MTTRPRGIWPLVSDRTRELLGRHATPLTFRHGERLIVQGTAETDVFVIRSGFVLVLRERAGARVALGVRGAGDLVGEHAGWSRRPRSATVVANGGVTALRWSWKVFDEIRAGSPLLTAALTHSFADKLDDADRRLADAALRTAGVRTARLLDGLVDRYGEELDDGTWALRVRLTDTDLADLVGVHVSSIERSMRALRRAGVLGADRNPFVVLDRELLHAYSRDENGAGPVT